MKGIILILLIVLLVGCTQKAEQVPKAVSNLEKFKMATIESPNIPAPNFKLTDSNGNELTNENLNGKVYLLQGYTYGCTSCAEEVATLNKIYTKYNGKGVEIISMDIVSEDIETALETKKKYNGGDWHWALDNDDVAVKFKMKSLESTYIIDKDGVIRYKDEAISDADVLSKEIEKLI
ncbi:MAG TPA: TlpA disulfide reductase family protein [Candidatus Nanoarchaeia archaeon]|nr:TlpA disulfide reductase family protein [Candidatus Nanoarchaeia archaeon]